MILFFLVKRQGLKANEHLFLMFNLLKNKSYDLRRSSGSSRHPPGCEPLLYWISFTLFFFCFFTCIHQMRISVMTKIIVAVFISIIMCITKTWHGEAKWRNLRNTIAYNSSCKCRIRSPPKILLSCQSFEKKNL